MLIFKTRTEDLLMSFLTSITFRPQWYHSRKHEWEKHGTCAGGVKEVSDELKYFNKSLSLYEQFDIFGYHFLTFAHASVTIVYR